MGQIIICKTQKRPQSSSIQSQQQSEINLNESIVEDNKDGYFSDEELKRYENLKLNEIQPNVKMIWVDMGEVIGQGSYGQVVLAMNQTNGQYIAVKSLSLKGFNIANTDIRIQSFKLEIDLLSRCSHPNIVKYYGMEQTDNKINVFLEYVAGGSLLSLINKYGKLKEILIQKYTKEILLGLEYLHAHGIIHRDIKGANILVDNNAVCKLADFGSSKLLIQKEDSKSLIGTPNWMAPEVIRQSGHGRFADIWSVGCTIIEMATGKPPWTDLMRKNQFQALMQIANGQAQITIPDTLSAVAQDFLRRCLDPEPKQRWNVQKLLSHPFLFDNAIQQNANDTSHLLTEVAKLYGKQ